MAERTNVGRRFRRDGGEGLGGELPLWDFASVKLSR